MMAYRGPGGGWIYPSLEEALKKAGLYTMEHYVNKRQQCIVDYISTRHCMAASRLATWDLSQDCLLVGSEEKAGEAGRQALGGWNSLSVKTLSFHPPPLLGSRPGPLHCPD